MIVVADTTPLNYLVLIGHIDILPRLFTRVLVPEAVITELRHPEAPTTVQDWATNPDSEWLEIRNPEILEDALEFLGAGERAAIALAREAGADALLIDERAGRREAARRGMRLLGTLAVLEEGGRRGRSRDLPARRSKPVPGQRPIVLTNEIGSPPVLLLLTACPFYQS